MKYVFGNFSANSKDAVKAHRKSLALPGVIYEPGVPGFDFLSALYGLHKDVFGHKIKALWFDRHPNRGGRELGALIQTSCGRLFEYPSYVYGLMPASDATDRKKREAYWKLIEGRKLSDQMRTMVADQVVLMRRGPTGYKIPKCVYCGVLAEEMNHEGIDFYEIRDMFLANPPGSLETADDSVDGAGVRFADPVVHQAWRDFHLVHARLEPVCVPCHRAYTASRKKLGATAKIIK